MNDESSLDDIAAPLRARLAELDAKIDAERAIIDAARARMATDETTAKALRTALDALDPTRRQAFECPECAKQFTSSQSLGVHRSRSHGYRATTKPVPAAPTSAPVPVGSDRVLKCADCDATFDVGSSQALAAHAMKAHGRRATAAERTPTRPVRGAA